MALRDMIRREVQKALSIGGPLDDIPTTISYQAASLTTLFDPASQEEQVASSPPISVQGVFLDYRSQEVDNVNVLMGDKQFYLSDLNRIKVGMPQPEINSLIRDSDSLLWKVVGIKHDPVIAHFILQVRQP